jgi:hypothetical protein
VHRLVATLDVVNTGVLVGDRRLGRAMRNVVDEHGAGCRDRLQSRCRVDSVAEHHPLAFGPKVNRGVSGQYADPHSQLVA